MIENKMREMKKDYYAGKDANRNIYCEFLNCSVFISKSTKMKVN